MRKKFVYVVFIPVLLVIIAFYLFLDSWVESGLETIGESAVGAKVEIDDLHLTLSPIGIHFARLQVANPRDTWKNTFETGTVKFALDFGQLLRGKFIIETMEVNELILGTKRGTDGALPRPGKEEPKQAEVADAGPSLAQQAQALVQEKKNSTPVFDLDKLRKQLNIDSLLNVQNLVSVQYIDSLKIQIARASEEWRMTLNAVETVKQKAENVEKSIKLINLNELKSIQAVTAALKNVNDARTGIKEINDTFTSRKAALTKEVNKFSTSIGLIDDLARRDFQNTLALARLPDVSMKGLAELLLGKDVLATAHEYLAWVDFAQSHIKNSSSTPENAHPPRMRGQTILFPAEKSYPKFWIKKILVSGGSDKEQDPNYFYATGEIRNISSNQRVTGIPMTVELSATQGRGTHATISASFNRTQDSPVDTYGVTLSGVPVKTLNLGRSDFVPSKISDALSAYSISATVPQNQFDADARIAFTQVTIDFDRPAQNTVERLVRGVLESVRAFNVKLRLWKNPGGALDVAFETDLDNLLADRTKRVIGDEVARLRNELRQKLEKKIDEKRREVEGLMNQKKEGVTVKLKLYEEFVNERVALVEAKKKELEDKIEAEKKKQEDSLKKKAQDALKGLLKKN